MIKKIIFLLATSLILLNCSGFREALTLKKQQQVDEFLIEKKNPLVLPPDYSKLPKPADELKVEEKQDNNIDLSKVLNKSDEIEDVDRSSELEDSISNILNKK
jgi:hypothetical protein